MESIHFSSLSMDKLISTQGLLTCLDKPLNQLNVMTSPRFAIPTTPQVAVALLRPSQLPPSAKVAVALLKPSQLPSSAKKKIAKSLKNIAEFIWENWTDFQEIIKNYPDKEEDEPERLPELPAPSTLPAHLVRKTEPWLLQLFKGRLNVPSHFNHTYIVAGFAFVALAVVLLFPRTAEVSGFREGEAAQVFCEVSNDRRFAWIFFQLNAFGSKILDYFLRGPFTAVDNDDKTCVDMCIRMSLCTPNSFILCLSSKGTFDIAFRGVDTVLVARAMMNGVVSPLLLGSIDVGCCRRGTFTNATNDIKFVVLASSILLDVLSYQQIVDLVPPKGTGIAEKIVRAAREKNPAIEDLNVAVIYLA